MREFFIFIKKYDIIFIERKERKMFMENRIINWYEKPKSKIKCGNYEINITVKFNWFQKKMWKIFFNCEIIDLED